MTLPLIISPLMMFLMISCFLPSALIVHAYTHTHTHAYTHTHTCTHTHTHIHTHIHTHTLSPTYLLSAVC